MGCLSTLTIKACLSSVYASVGFFLLFYIIAFAIETKHTHSSCELAAGYTDGSAAIYRDCKEEFNPDPCDAPAMVAKTQYTGKLLGKDYVGEVKMVCAWSTETLVMNYLSIPILVAFFVMFFHIFKKFRLLHIMVVGLFAAIFILISIVLMIRDIDTGLKHKKDIEPTTKWSFSYYPAVFIVNVIFTILAFLALLRIFCFAHSRNRQLSNKKSELDTEEQPMAESEKQSEKEEKKREKEEMKKEKKREKQEKKALKKGQKNNSTKNEPKFGAENNENDGDAIGIRI